VGKHGRVSWNAGQTALCPPGKRRILFLAGTCGAPSPAPLARPHIALMCIQTDSFPHLARSRLGQRPIRRWACRALALDNTYPSGTVTEFSGALAVMRRACAAPEVGGFCAARRAPLIAAEIEDPPEAPCDLFACFRLSAVRCIALGSIDGTP
jgi:hypothetical protein